MVLCAGPTGYVIFVVKLTLLKIRLRTKWRHHFFSQRPALFDGHLTLTWPGSKCAGFPRGGSEHHWWGERFFWWFCSSLPIFTRQIATSTTPTMASSIQIAALPPPNPTNTLMSASATGVGVGGWRCRFSRRSGHKYRPGCRQVSGWGWDELVYHLWTEG